MIDRAIRAAVPAQRGRTAGRRPVTGPVPLRHLQALMTHASTARASASMVVSVLAAALLAGCGTSLTVEAGAPGFDESAYVDSLQYCKAKYGGGGSFGEDLFYLVATVAPTEGIDRLDNGRTRPTRAMFEDDAVEPTPEGKRLQDVSFERNDAVNSDIADQVVGCLAERGYTVRTD